MEVEIASILREIDQAQKHVPRPGDTARNRRVDGTFGPPKFVI